MSELSYRFALGGFLLLAPTVCLLRYLFPQFVRRWLAAAVILAGSWLLAYAYTFFYYAHLDTLVLGNPDVSQELLDRWANDGAKNVFSVFFGWAYGAIYALPFYAVYKAACWFRNRGRKSGTAAA